MRNLTNRITQIGIVFCLLCFHLQLHSQAWEQLNDTPFQKHHSNGFGFGDKAYIFEGTFENDGPQNISNEVWEYDPSEDSWTRIEDFPGPGRAIAIGDDWNGKYYYGFGRGENGPLNDLWVFDPIDQSHRQLPACPCEGRSHPALIAHNDKIHMGSGSSAMGDVDDWWEFDIETEVWTQKEDIPGGNRHHPFFFAHENKVYLGGGHKFNWLSYDLDTEEWEEIDNAPQGRVAGSQLSYKGKGLIIGGDDADHVHVPDFETFMSYDPDTDTWRYLPELPNGSRWACSSFIINDELFFFGGLSSNIVGDVSLWKFDLQFIDCLPAQGLTATAVTDTTASIFWTQNGDPITDTLKFRELGTTDWNVILDPQAVLVIDGLDACQEYEMVFLSECESLSSSTDTVLFKTDGCCENPIFEITDVEENMIRVNWSNVLAAEGYNVQWREEGTEEWSEEYLTDLSLDIVGLNACTVYEIAVSTECVEGEIDLGETFLVTTKGCGACLDNEFCMVPEEFDGSFIFINEVSINDYTNSSGNDGGYGNYVVPDGVSLTIGDSYDFSFDPGITDQGFPSTLAVWIDYDGDGVFELDELAWQVFNVSQSISKVLDMPMDALPGLTRMRVVFGIAPPDGPCEDGGFSIGEAEDYCLLIEDVDSAVDDADKKKGILVHPNPFESLVHFSGEFLSSNQDDYSLTITNIVGENVFRSNNFDPNQAFDTSGLSQGLYFITIESAGEKQTVKVIKQ